MSYHWGFNQFSWYRVTTNTDPINWQNVLHQVDHYPGKWKIIVSSHIFPEKPNIKIDNELWWLSLYISSRLSLLFSVLFVIQHLIRRSHCQYIKLWAWTSPKAHLCLSQKSMSIAKYLSNSNVWFLLQFFFL